VLERVVRQWVKLSLPQITTADGRADAMAEIRTIAMNLNAHGVGRATTQQRDTNVKTKMNKYLRKLPAIVGPENGSAVYDVYSVLVGFDVVCPARQHAIKKLLCAGLRGKGDVLQDLREALQAVERAIELEQHKYA
jgi:hypothetical protein